MSSTLLDKASNRTSKPFEKRFRLIEGGKTGLWVRAREAERRALKAEDDAKVVRNEAVQANEELKKARVLEAEARAAAKAGDVAAAKLHKQAVDDLHPLAASLPQRS